MTMCATRRRIFLRNIQSYNIAQEFESELGANTEFKDMPRPNPCPIGNVMQSFDSLHIYNPPGFGGYHLLQPRSSGNQIQVPINISNSGTNVGIGSTGKKRKQTPAQGLAMATKSRTGQSFR